jgi:hypothetical protein
VKNAIAISADTGGTVDWTKVSTNTIVQLLQGCADRLSLAAGALSANVWRVTNP